MLPAARVVSILAQLEIPPPLPPGSPMFSAHTQPLQLRDGFVAAALFVVALVTGGMRMAPGVCGVFHDDAIYVSTAQSLADGEGYRLQGIPGTPPQTKFPVLYPALLAMIWKLGPQFPDNITAMQWFNIVCAGASLALGYLYLVRFRYCSRAVAAAAAILSATAATYLYVATTTMAEMPFALLVVAALWGIDEFLAKPNRSRRAELGLGILAALPFLCRTIGAPMAPVAAWLLWRSGRRVVWCLVGSAFVVAPWIVWSAAGRGIWNQDQVTGYYTDYLGCWSSTGLGMTLRVVEVNGLATAFGTTEFTAEGASHYLLSVIPEDAVMPLLVGLGAAPWLMVLTQLNTRRALPHFLAAYLGVILVWSWLPYRFLIPVMPLISAYLLQGIITVAGRFLSWCPRSGMVWAGAVATALLVACNLGLLVSHSRLTAQYGYPYTRLTTKVAHWSSYQQLFDWLNENTSSDDVIAAGLDSMVSLYSDRKAIRPFVYHPERLFYGDGSQPLITPDELQQILEVHQPKYFISMPMPGFSEAEFLEAALHELDAERQGWLRVVYRGADQRFTVYEIVPAPQQDEASAATEFDANLPST